MKIGFTGTREGMTLFQMEAFVKLIRSLLLVEEFHHGMCIGADEDAHKLIREYFPHVRIIGHPPDNPALMVSNLDLEELRATLPYLTRNNQIVRETDRLIAAPKERIEKIRSGTWATIRRARIYQKPIDILLRSDEEN